MLKVMTFVFFMTTGFADCYFSASQSTYSLTSCPETYQWPDTLESLDKSVKAERVQFSGEAGRCQTLRRYKVRLIKGGEFDEYVGISATSPCKLILAPRLVGPKAPDEIFLGTTRKVNTDFISALPQNLSALIDLGSEKSEIIGDITQTEEWCKKLKLISVQ